MDKYYICRVDRNDLVKVNAIDDYYDAVIEVVTYCNSKGWEVVVVHGTKIYKVK